MEIRKYYSTEREFDRIHSRIKLLHCPHCRRSGLLILHGYLYGYGETELVQRGHRIFCSNRNKKTGCGKTFSFLLAGCLENFMIFGRFLSAFLENISQGLCLSAAFNKVEAGMSTTTIYRLYTRFKENQSRIRTCLIRVKDPPALQDTCDPVIQTITHLKSVFKGCIVAQFQHRFQLPFLT